MTHTMMPLGCDPQRIKGMSGKLIVSHYENNYGGAVKRLNLITEQLAGLDFNTAPNFLINGLKLGRPPGRNERLREFAANAGSKYCLKRCSLASGHR